MKKLLILMLVTLLLVSAVGCTASKPLVKEGVVGVKETDLLSISVEGEDYPLKVKDYLKQETVLDKKPERVAVLSGTPLNIWYDLGGKSVCSSDITENLKLIPEYKEELLKLPTVGAVYSVDMEAIVAQKPDLIIAQVGTQINQSKRLREMGFKVINTYIRSYEDVISTYRAFGKILGAEAAAEARIQKLEEKKSSIVESLPLEGKSVVILYLTSRSLAVKLDNSIAGDIAKMLNLENIASDLPPDTIGSENTPLDIEYIVAKNPDYVLVASMIDNNEAAKAAMEQEFRNNPVWKGVKAVAEGRVLYLPQEYFLYNAGPYYDEAIEYMARGLYPEVYGEVQDWYGR